MQSGGVTEWLMVADCKSAGLTPYVGSNPTPTMDAGPSAGVAQLVEHQPSKLRVAGSSPVARFRKVRPGGSFRPARVAARYKRVPAGRERAPVSAWTTREAHG